MTNFYFAWFTLLTPLSAPKLVSALVEKGITVGPIDDYGIFATPGCLLSLSLVVPDKVKGKPTKSQKEVFLVIEKIAKQAGVKYLSFVMSGYQGHVWASQNFESHKNETDPSTQEDNPNLKQLKNIAEDFVGGGVSPTE